MKYEPKEENTIKFKIKGIEVYIGINSGEIKEIRDGKETYSVPDYTQEELKSELARAIKKKF